jgi:hypothetical protein
MPGPFAFGADTVDLSKEITALFASKVRRDGEFPDQCPEVTFERRNRELWNETRVLVRVEQGSIIS